MNTAIILQDASIVISLGSLVGMGIFIRNASNRFTKVEESVKFNTKKIEAVETRVHVLETNNPIKDIVELRNDVKRIKDELLRSREYRDKHPL